MKTAKSIVVFFLTLTLQAVSTDAEGQVNLVQKLRFAAKRVSLKEALEIISDKAKVDFAYNTNKLPLKEKFLLDPQGESLEIILNKMVALFGLNYKIVGKTILIDKELPIIEQKPATISYEIADDTLKKVYTITGIVIDAETNRPIPGVLVSLRRYSTKVKTDKQGKFSLTIHY